jgi:hypothetical protein
MANHEHYRELCALAALGDVSGSELTELKGHIQDCNECRSVYTDFTRILSAELPLADGKRLSARRFSQWFLRDGGYRNRFLLRARADGVQFSEGVEEPPRSSVKVSWPALSYKYAATLVILGLVAALAISFSRLRESKAQNLDSASEIARLNQENVGFREQVAALMHGGSSLEVELSQARSKNVDWAARYKQLEEQLQETSTSMQALATEVETSQEDASVARSHLQDANQTIAVMERELQALQQTRSQDGATIALQEAQLEQLSRRLAQQEKIMDRERRLLVADRDIRELMGARNLHIIDVFDVDGKGKNRQAFGRVFHTEGKSLIFYAFDLAQPEATLANHSYQAWGQREGSSASTVSLGILYMDSVEQQRWVLKFDDPRVLDEINALFVTVEPHGGGERPSGDKLLYAYLGTDPNHP